MFVCLVVLSDCMWFFLWFLSLTACSVFRSWVQIFCHLLSFLHRRSRTTGYLLHICRWLQFSCRNMSMRVPCEQLQYGRYNFCLATFAGIFWSNGSLQDHITTVNFPFGLLAYLICFSWTYWSYFVWNPSSVQYLTIDTGCGVAPLYVHVFHIVPLCLWVLGLWTISRESLHSNHSMVLTVPTENPWTSEARFSDNISAIPVSRQHFFTDVTEDQCGGYCHTCETKHEEGIAIGESDARSLSGLDQKV